MREKCGRVLLAGLVGFSVLAPVVVRADTDRKSPYAGQQTRKIKALSGEDIRALRAGEGWGFAKAAELNGWPGPIHVLELAEPLKLTASQRRDMKALYEKMRAAAIPLGRQLVNLESRLDRLFADRSVTPDSLAALTRQIGDVRARLRAVHLRAHLATPSILTARQVAQYNKLRGYGGPGKHHHGPHRHHKH